MVSLHSKSFVVFALACSVAAATEASTCTADGGQGCHTFGTQLLQKKAHKSERNVSIVEVDGEEEQAWVEKSTPKGCRCNERARIYGNLSKSLEECKSKCNELPCEQIDYNVNGWCNVYSSTCSVDQNCIGEWTAFSPAQACADTWSPGWGASSAYVCQVWLKNSAWGALADGRTKELSCASEWGRQNCASSCGCRSGMWVVGNQNSNSCPDQTVITTLTKCKGAAVSLGANWKLAITEHQKWPKGCFLFNHKDVYYNVGSVGRAKETSAPICEACSWTEMGRVKMRRPSSGNSADYLYAGAFTGSLKEATEKASQLGGQYLTKYKAWLQVVGADSYEDVPADTSAVLYECKVSEAR